ncbi:MAG: carboxylate-amine ligase, partial [Pseudanabaena sp. CRU_2_10]|nr:carboxylate-amine ligase [Pseudanabaena sp. CRU_2_10]
MVSEGRSSHLCAMKAKFRQLQAQLRDRWQTIEQFDLSDYDILVVPSLSLDQSELLKVSGSHHYEERLLFSLIRLRNPRTRLVYITSQPLAPIIIDYYLQLLPGIPFSHARERLVLFSTYDASHIPLTQKILDRPRLIDRIRNALRPQKAYMICYNSTPLERQLSVELGIPLWALDPELLPLGTKSGSRSIFAETDIPYPDGSQLV